MTVPSVYPQLPSLGEKQCSKCLHTKSLTAFRAQNGCRGGYRPECTACMNRIRRERYRQRVDLHPSRFSKNSHLIRHDYFSEMTTPLQAYILGFLATDGCVLPSVHRITWSISVKDRPLLEMLRDELAPGHRISSSFVKSPMSDRMCEMLKFTYSSRQVTADVLKMGVCARKTYTLRWPALLPDRLAHAFLLGVFDGDGSMGYTSDHHRQKCYPRWQLTSASPGFMDDIRAVVLRLLGIEMAPSRPQVKGQPTHTLRICGQGAHTLDEWMHHDSFGLERKRIRALKTPYPIV